MNKKDFGIGVVVGTLLGIGAVILTGLGICEWAEYYRADDSAQTGDHPEDWLK